MIIMAMMAIGLTTNVVTLVPIAMLMYDKGDLVWQKIVPSTLYLK